jgi:ElaB/YqjD/DUF883 family membrane-anchored ribosome-binding protein
MFNSAELKDELRLLKDEVSRLLDSTSEGILDSSRTRAQALTEEITATFKDLGDVLSEQEGHLTEVISERPIAALASAFALGLVAGLMLRRN